MSDRELVIGNSVHTMRDPAFIAGLTNTFDGTKAALEIIQNLPKRRLVVKTGSTILIITCNKKADLVFTWQTSNVINFPSTDITDIASASQADGVDLVTITNTVASGKSSFEISRIGNRFLKQYVRCKVDYAYGGEESFTDGTCDTTDTSVTITCESSANIAVGQYLSGTGIPVGSKVETVNSAGSVTSFTITTAATASNTDETLTFHGETAASNPCLIRLTEGDDPSINDNVKDVLPIHKDRG